MGLKAPLSFRVIRFGQLGQRIQKEIRVSLGFSIVYCWCYTEMLCNIIKFATEIMHIEIYNTNISKEHVNFNCLQLINAYLDCCI